MLCTYEFIQSSPNERAVRTFLERRRWGNIPVCGHCGSSKISECKDDTPMAYRCRTCRKHFSIRTGTILSESRLPLRKWITAIWLVTNTDGDATITHVAHELCVTLKTAKFLKQRIQDDLLEKKGDGKIDNNSLFDESNLDIIIGAVTPSLNKQKVHSMTKKSCAELEKETIKNRRTTGDAGWTGALSSTHKSESGWC